MVGPSNETNLVEANLQSSAVDAGFSKVWYTDLDKALSILEAPGNQTVNNMVYFLSLLGRFARPTQAIIDSLGLLKTPVTQLPEGDSNRVYLLPFISTTDGCSFIALLWSLMSMFPNLSDAASFACDALCGLLEIHLDLVDRGTRYIEQSQKHLCEIYKAVNLYGQGITFIDNFALAFKGFVAWVHTRYPDKSGEDHVVTRDFTNKTNPIKPCNPCPQALAQHICTIVRCQINGSVTHKTPIVMLGFRGVAFLATYTHLILGLPIALHDDSVTRSDRPLDTVDVPYYYLENPDGNPFFTLAGCGTHLKAAVLFFPDLTTEEELVYKGNTNIPASVEYKYSITRNVGRFINLGPCRHFPGSWKIGVYLPDTSGLGLEEGKKARLEAIRAIEKGSLGSGKFVTVPGWDDTKEYVAYQPEPKKEE